MGRDVDGQRSLGSADREGLIERPRGAPGPEHIRREEFVQWTDPSAGTGFTRERIVEHEHIVVIKKALKGSSPKDQSERVSHVTFGSE